MELSSPFLYNIVVFRVNDCWLGMDGVCLVQTGRGQFDGSRPRFRETHRHVPRLPQWKKYRVYHSKIKMGFNLLMAPFCDAVHNGYTAQDVRISDPYCSENLSFDGAITGREQLANTPWKVACLNWSNNEMLELFYLWMISRFSVHQPTWQMKSSQICR